MGYAMSSTHIRGRLGGAYTAEHSRPRLKTQESQVPGRSLLIRRRTLPNLQGRNCNEVGKAGTDFRWKDWENLRVGAQNVKGQDYERSQEVVENKGKCFFRSVQTQEVYENTGVIFVKPRGC